MRWYEVKITHDKIVIFLHLKWFRYKKQQPKKKKIKSNFPHLIINCMNAAGFLLIRFQVFLHFTTKLTVRHRFLNKKSPTQSCLYSTMLIVPLSVWWDIYVAMVRAWWMRSNGFDTGKKTKKHDPIYKDPRKTAIPWTSTLRENYFLCHNPSRGSLSCLAVCALSLTKW